MSLSLFLGQVVVDVGIFCTKLHISRTLMAMTRYLSIKGSRIPLPLCDIPKSLEFQKSKDQLQNFMYCILGSLMWYK